MKTKYMQIRISEELREQFRKVNEKRSVNSSDLIRKWIEKYIKENQKYLS